MIIFLKFETSSGEVYLNIERIIYFSGNSLGTDVYLENDKHVRLDIKVWDFEERLRAGLR